jgi:hypothetical protein
VYEKTTARCFNQVVDLDESFVTACPRVGYVTAPRVGLCECGVKPAEADYAVMKRRFSSIAQIAFIHAVHGQNKVVKRRIAGVKRAGSRCQFDSAATSLSACSIVG